MRAKLKIIGKATLRFVADWMERACCLFHWVPFYTCQLATWSSILDEKHDLGVWTKIEPGDKCVCCDEPAKHYYKNSKLCEKCFDILTD